MLVIVGAVFILHECRNAMVKIDHTVCEEILLVMEMNLFGGNAWNPELVSILQSGEGAEVTIGPVGLGMTPETYRDLLDLDSFGDLQMDLTPQDSGLFAARVMLVVALQI